MTINRKPNPGVVAVVSLLLLGGVPCCRAAGTPAAGGRQMLSFDQAWRFHLGEVEGGEVPALADATWHTVDVPHDFSIEGPFDMDSPGGTGAGALNGGIGWHRKTFTLHEGSAGKRVGVRFDGVYMDSEVWLNGVSVGKQLYGYTSFEYDLTTNLKPGSNILAVRVNVLQPCSRWYSGAGIYRHVWLTLTDPVHVAPWGTYVTTPQVSHAAAQVCVRTQLRNEGADEVRAILTTAILDAAGIKVAEQQAEQMLVGGGCHEAVQTLTVSTPQRWSTTEPYLYQVVSEVWVGERLVDRSATPLGIRALEFTADNGFLLNGKALGRKDFKDNKSLHLEWQVPYAAGVLKAVGMKDGQTIIDEVRTAGEPAKLIVRPDRQHSASCSLESNCCQDPREVTLNDNHEY